MGYVSTYHCVEFGQLLIYSSVRVFRKDEVSEVEYTTSCLVIRHADHLVI